MRLWVEDKAWEAREEPLRAVLAGRPVDQVYFKERETVLQAIPFHAAQKAAQRTDVAVREKESL